MNGLLGMNFYEQFQRLEKDIDVYRNEELICHIKGEIGGDESVMLPPSKNIDVKVHDMLKDGYNKFIVLSIHRQDEESVWILKVETYDSYSNKHKDKSTSVINNVNSDNFNQNVGDYGNITFKQQQSYSVDDLYNLIAEIKDSKDKATTAELASEMQKVSSDDSKPKKGFLNRFDKLIAKYPNISKIVSGLLVQWATN